MLRCFTIISCTSSFVDNKTYFRANRKYRSISLNDIIITAISVIPLSNNKCRTQLNSKGQLEMLLNFLGKTHHGSTGTIWITGGLFRIYLHIDDSYKYVFWKMIVKLTDYEYVPIQTFFGPVISCPLLRYMLSRASLSTSFSTAVFIIKQ